MVASTAEMRGSGRVAARFSSPSSTLRASLALAVACAVFAGARADDSELCSHTFDSAGVGFNLSPLTPTTEEPFSFQRVNDRYEMTLCGNLASPCREGPCASDVRSTLDPDTPLFNNGVFGADTLSWELLDSAEPTAGVVLTMGGGSDCTGSSRQTVQRSTRVAVTCNEDAREPTNVQWNLDVECAVHVSMESYAGCPSYYSSGLSGGWIFIILLLVASGVYFGGGSMYKRATLGASGVEAIPNIDGWRDFFEYVRAGCEYSYGIATCDGHSQRGFEPELLDETEDVGQYAAPPGDESVL
mmetsp:Transcript_17158/g.40190  ORF Transcript_17158/g.40190 Transcript_17158/m.40190 type:complete len:300 (-) Transcript_17158:72-971(-)